MVAQDAEQAAKLAGLDQQIAQKQAEGDEAAAALAKSQASLPWLRQQAELRRALLNVQFSNKLAWLEVEQLLAEPTHDLPVLAARQVQAAAAQAALERQRAQAVAEYRKTVLADLAKAEQAASQAREDLAKASEKLRQLVLRAPIDGTVQQLALHTVGGVVSPAQAVLVVVPDAAGLEVEAQVANKDVGFVHAGQVAAVKVEAFSFTRYGLIEGTVVGVSRDAVVEDRAGQPAHDKPSDRTNEDSDDHDASPGYTAHIALGQTELVTENGVATLEAGMAVTAEIKTGRRSVISYLLSPLQRYAHEGMTER
jgi:hemolysin D